MQRILRHPAVVAASLTLLVQLWLCHFFEFGARIPMSGDINPGNYRAWRCFIPPQPGMSLDYWLGWAQDTKAVTLTSVFAHLSPWLFFTFFYPLCAALSVGGAYFLSRQVGLSRPASVVAGLVYGWQGWLLTNLLSGHFAPAEFVAWLPFAAGFLMRAVARRSWLSAAASGVFAGLMVTVGLDRGLLGSLFLVGVGLCALVLQVRREASALGGSLLRLTVSGILSLVVAWQTVSSLLPSQGTLHKGSGGDVSETFQWATQWSHTPEDFLAYAVPGFFGWRIGNQDGPYWGRIGRSEGWAPGMGQQGGFRNFYQESTGFGTAGALLVVLGAGLVLGSRRKDGTGAVLEAGPRAWGLFFLGVAVVCVVLGLGKFTPLYEAVFRLPLMSWWRNPQKWLSVGHLAFAVLAGLAAEGVAAWGRGATVPERLVKVLHYLPFAAVFGWGVTFLLDDGFKADRTREGYLPTEIDAMLSTMHTSAFVAAVVVSLAALLLKLVITAAAQRARKFDSADFQRQWRGWFAADRLGVTLAAGLGVLTVVQMTWVFTHYIEPYDWNAVYNENPKPFFDRITKEGLPVRVKVFNQDPVLHFYLSTALAYHQIQAVDIPAASRIPDDYAEFFKALGNQPARLWQLAGCRYLLLPAPLLGQLTSQLPAVGTNIIGVSWFLPQGTSTFDLRFVPVAEPRTLPPDAQQMLRGVAEVRNYVPKASVVTGVEVLPDGAAVLRRLADPAWDPHVSVVLSADEAKKAGLAQPLTAAATPATARVVSYRDWKIEVEVTSPAPGVLRVNDRFEKDWRATVDGKAAPVVRADYLLRGVPVPAGTSRVVLQMETPSGGVYAGLIAMLVVAGWGVASVKRSMAAPVRGKSA